MDRVAFRSFSLHSDISHSSCGRQRVYYLANAGPCTCIILVVSGRLLFSDAGNECTHQPALPWGTRHLIWKHMALRWLEKM